MNLSWELFAPFNEFFICPAATNYIDEDQKLEDQASDSHPKKCSRFVSLESKLRKICERSSYSSPVESLLSETPPSVEDIIPVLKNVPLEFKFEKLDDEIQKTPIETELGKKIEEHLTTPKITYQLPGYDKDVEIIKDFAQYQYIMEKPSEYVMEEILNRCFQSLESKLDTLPSQVKHKLDLSFILDEVLNNVFEYTKNEVIMKRARFYTQKVYPKFYEKAVYTKKPSERDPLSTDDEVEVQKHADAVVSPRKRPREKKIGICAGVCRKRIKREVKPEKRRRFDLKYDTVCTVDEGDFADESETLSTGTASISEIDKTFEQACMKNSLHICTMDEYLEKNDMRGQKESSSRNGNIFECVRKKICPDFEEIRITNKSSYWSERVPSFISNILSTQEVKKCPIRAGCADSGSQNMKLSARNGANRCQREDQCSLQKFIRKKFSRCSQNTSGTSERNSADVQSRKSSQKYTQKQKLVPCRNLERISNRSVTTNSPDSKVFSMEKGCKCSITMIRENSEDLNMKKSSIRRTKKVKSVVFPEYTPEEDKENQSELSDYNKYQSTVSITRNFRAKDSVMVHRKAKERKNKNRSHPSTIDENYDDDQIKDIFVSRKERKSTIYFHPDYKYEPSRKTVRMLSQGTTYPETLDSGNQKGNSQNFQTEISDEKTYEETGRLEHAEKQQAPDKISCLTDIKKSSSSGTKKNKKVFIAVDTIEDHHANPFESSSGGSPLKSAISITRTFPVKDSVLIYKKSERKKTKAHTYPKSVVGTDTDIRPRDLSSCMKAKEVNNKSKGAIVPSEAVKSPKHKSKMESESCTQDKRVKNLDREGEKRKSQDAQIEYPPQKTSEEIGMVKHEEQRRIIPNKKLNDTPDRRHKPTCPNFHNLDSTSCGCSIEAGHIHSDDFDMRKSSSRKTKKIKTIVCPEYNLEDNGKRGHLGCTNRDFLVKDSATIYKGIHPVVSDRSQVDNNSVDQQVYLTKITKNFSCRCCNTLSRENIRECTEKIDHVSPNNFDDKKSSTRGAMKKKLVVCTKYAPDDIEQDGGICSSHLSTNKQNLHLSKSTPIERKSKKKKRNCHLGTCTDNVAGFKMKCESIDSQIENECVGERIVCSEDTKTVKLQSCPRKSQDFRSHSLPLKLTKSPKNVEDNHATACRIRNEKCPLKKVITDLAMKITKNDYISTCTEKLCKKTNDLKESHLNFSSERPKMSEDVNIQVEDRIYQKEKNKKRKKCLCCQKRRKKTAAGTKLIPKMVKSAGRDIHSLEKRSTGMNVGICTEDTCLRRSNFSLESIITIKERCISFRKVCDANVGRSLEEIQKSLSDEVSEGVEVSVCGRKKCPATFVLSEGRLTNSEVSKAASKQSKVSFSPIAISKPFSSMNLTLGLTKVPDMEYNIEMILKEIMKKIFESEIDSTSTSNVVPNSEKSTQEEYGPLQNRTTKEGVFHVCQKKNVLPLNFPCDLNCIFTNDYQPQFEITVEQVAKFVVPLKEILSKMLERAMRLSEIEISIFDRKKRKKPGRPKTREIVVRILNYQLLFETEIFRKVSLAYGNMKFTL